MNKFAHSALLKQLSETTTLGELEKIQHHLSEFHVYDDTLLELVVIADNKYKELKGSQTNLLSHGLFLNFMSCIAHYQGQPHKLIELNKKLNEYTISGRRFRAKARIKEYLIDTVIELNKEIDKI